MDSYVHSVPGRLRVRNQRFKSADAQYLVKQRLASEIGMGIGTVEFNATTGSVLIHYNPSSVLPGDILRVLENAGYYHPARVITNDQLVHSAASKAMNLVTKSVSGAVFETAFAGTGLQFLAILL